jgi:hypothetical protein
VRPGPAGGHGIGAEPRIAAGRSRRWASLTIQIVARERQSDGGSGRWAREIRGSVDSVVAMTVVIDGQSLSVEQVVGVARRGELVSISEAAIERMRQSRLKVERVLGRDDAVYVWDDDRSGAAQAPPSGGG